MNLLDEDEKVNIRLKSGIDLSDLLSEKGTTFEVDLDDTEPTEESYDPSPVELLEHANTDCLGLDDEESYADDVAEPFEQLAQRMFDVTPDGGVKKRVIREGVGEGVPRDGFVTCNYNGYVEYNAEPFDSTYAFRRPLRFQLGSGAVIRGLEEAVLSMKINEKSQFIFTPDYAYGQHGCLDRIGENSKVLFEIELNNCINSGAADTFKEQEGEEKERTFDDVYVYAQALKLKGNDYFKQNLLKQAVKEYNRAITKLERCQLADYADQEKQQALMLTLFTNLVVAYTKMKLPKKACTCSNNLKYMVKGTSLKIPSKVYFNTARSLIMLGNLTEAESNLKNALQLEPTNSEIADEYIRLDKLKKEKLEKEKRMAKGLIGSDTDKREQ